MNDYGSCDPGPTFVVRINTWKMLMQSKVLQELIRQLIVVEVKKRHISFDNLAARKNENVNSLASVTNCLK